MNQENRVLTRTGARELTTEEVERVGAARIRTLTACTLPFVNGFVDGDAGECGGG